MALTSVGKPHRSGDLGPSLSSERSTKVDNNVQIGAWNKSTMACRRRCLRVRPVTELGWEGADQFAATDPVADVLPQQFGDRRDDGRAGACFLDGNSPGERQIVDG